MLLKKKSDLLILVGFVILLLGAAGDSSTRIIPGWVKVSIGLLCIVVGLLMRKNEKN